MPDYALYLESGPKRRKTMVHALDILGCVAVGPTTEAALDATPEAIRAYLRFIERHGEPVDPGASFSTTIAEHITEGMWLGNGSPYIAFGPDLEPLSETDVEVFLHRFHCLRQELAGWAALQSDADLEAKPAGGRTGRAILLHIIGVPGGYLSAALGGAAGFSKVAGAAERHEVGLAEGLMSVDALAAERVHATTHAERAQVRERARGDLRTLRKALRRMLEHDWEHLEELSRRPGGPAI